MFLALCVVAGALATSTLFASAAWMWPPSDAYISILTDDVSIAPPEVLVASDDFSGCSNQLDGWTGSYGHEWANHWGRWQCLGGGLVRSQFRLPLAHASIDVGRSDDIVVSARIERISTQRGRSGPGLALFTDGFFHMYVIYERDRGVLTFGKWSPWSNTALESVSIPDRPAAVLSVVVDQPTLTVLVDGVAVMTYDLGQLTSEEQDYFLSLNRFGLEADLDNWSRFDAFEIEVIP